ncbi:hypothetical protein Tco_1154359 [Tanacetum coccineum]
MGTIISGRSLRGQWVQVVPSSHFNLPSYSSDFDYYFKLINLIQKEERRREKEKKRKKKESREEREEEEGKKEDEEEKKQENRRKKRKRREEQKKGLKEWRAREKFSSDKCDIDIYSPDSTSLSLTSLSNHFLNFVSSIVS